MYISLIFYEPTTLALCATKPLVTLSAYRRYINECIYLSTKSYEVYVQCKA